MKKKVWLAALAVAVLFSATPVWADGDYYVITGTPPVGTKITGVPYTINDPGFYFLAGNLSCGNDIAITVNADNVTLDLMGFSLTGPGANAGSAVGIYMSGRSNVEARNGTVKGFSIGVCEDTQTGNKHRVINIRAINNNKGVLLSGQNHLIKNCSGSDNSTDGLRIGSSGLITDSVANNNGQTGIFLGGPGSLLGNTACNNTSRNFWIGSGAFSTSILADRNSAFGLNPNYYVPTGVSGVVVTANNSGTP